MDDKTLRKRNGCDYLMRQDVRKGIADEEIDGHPAIGGRDSLSTDQRQYLQEQIGSSEADEIQVALGDHRFPADAHRGDAQGSLKRIGLATPEDFKNRIDFL